MTRRYFDQKILLDWLDELIKSGRVVAPKKSGGQVIFDILAAAQEWENKTLLAKTPAKGIVFPPRRVIGDETVVPAVLWGMRPCDMQAFGVLDAVFLAPPVDEVYKKQREALTTVVFACPEKAASCFCDRVGSHPADGQGADILAIPIENGFVLESRTKKGEDLLAEKGEEAGEEDLNIALRFIADKKEEAVKADPLPEHLIETFKKEVWQEISQGCLSCGVCSFLCPTCHCFDIADERNKKVVFWDCCAFPDFTVMTSGENPRSRQESRLRNRILHKFDYLVRTIGRRGCVGCGRCIINCPAGLDIVEMINAVENAMAKVEGAS